MPTQVSGSSYGRGAHMFSSTFIFLYVCNRGFSHALAKERGSFFPKSKGVWNLPDKLIFLCLLYLLEFKLCKDGDSILLLFLSLFLYIHNIWHMYCAIIFC